MKKILISMMALSLFVIPFVAEAHQGAVRKNDQDVDTGWHWNEELGKEEYHPERDQTKSGIVPESSGTPALTSGQTTAPTPNADESTSTAPAGQTSGGAKVSYKDVKTKLTVVKHNWVNYNTYSQVKKEYQNR